MHKFDIICLSVTFLNNTYKDNDLNLNGYSLLRADHPSNAKRGGVCIYYKENLPLKLISTPYLNESLLCEVTIGSKKCIIGTVYRSPSQNSDEFESFLSNFEFLLQDISNRNPYLTLLLGDYNARNTNWWHHDITTTEGVQLETTTTIYGLQQLIDEPTHIRKNSSSCNDLIFVSQPTLLSIEEHILLFMKIVNTKLPLLRPGLELNILHLTNAMYQIMQKLTLME